jgi:hypothetical protein
MVHSPCGPEPPLTIVWSNRCTRPLRFARPDESGPVGAAPPLRQLFGPHGPHGTGTFWRHAEQCDTARHIVRSKGRVRDSCGPLDHMDRARPGQPRRRPRRWPSQCLAPRGCWCRAYGAAEWPTLSRRAGRSVRWTVIDYRLSKIRGNVGAPMGTDADDDDGLSVADLDDAYVDTAQSADEARRHLLSADAGQRP